MKCFLCSLPRTREQPAGRAACFSWNRAEDLWVLVRSDCLQIVVFIQLQVLATIFGLTANLWDARFASVGFGGRLRLCYGMQGVGLTAGALLLGLLRCSVGTEVGFFVCFWEYVLLRTRHMLSGALARAADQVVCTVAVLLPSIKLISCFPKNIVLRRTLVKNSTK